MEIGYHKGQVGGLLARENIKFGGFVFEGQDFIEAITPNEEFKNVVFDGILGLGFPRLAVKGTMTILENMVKQQSITKNIFSIWLTKNGGVIIFGGYNEEHFKEDHTYVPVITRPIKDYWKVKMTTFFIDNKPTKHCVAQCTVIIDSGMTDILGPPVRKLNFSDIFYKILPKTIMFLCVYNL